MTQATSPSIFNSLWSCLSYFIGNEPTPSQQIASETETQNNTPSSNRLKRVADKIESFEVEQRSKRLKEPLDTQRPAQKPIPKLIRRKVYIPTEGSTSHLKASAEVKVQKALSSTDIREHAASRVRIFAKTAYCYYKSAMRSDPEKQRKAEFVISRADFQLGKGSHGYHASHDDAGAGVADNLRQLMIEETTSEQAMTPMKKNLLKAKAFSDEDFDEMKENGYTPEAVTAIFDRMWPTYEKSHTSLFSGSVGIFERNRTTELPARVNLICDKRLETAMRPILAKLYALLAFGEVTPEEATEYYCEAIKSHLNGTQEEIEQRLNALEQYSEALDDFLEESYKTTPGVKKIAAILLMMRQQTMSPSEHGVARPWLPNNDKFLSKLNDPSFEPDGLDKLNRFLARHIKKMKREIQNERNKFRQVFIHNKEEEYGTTLPIYSNLFGAPNERAVRRPANVEADLEAKMLMLAPHFQPIRI